MPRSNLEKPIHLLACFLGGGRKPYNVQFHSGSRVYSVALKQNYITNITKATFTLQPSLVNHLDLQCECSFSDVRGLNCHTKWLCTQITILESFLVFWGRTLPFVTGIYIFQMEMFISVAFKKISGTYLDCNCIFKCTFDVVPIVEVWQKWDATV